MGQHPVSMLQWGHDFSAVEMPRQTEPGSRSHCCFNGATTFQPWKLRVDVDNRRGPKLLQWGHDFSAVEIEKHIAPLQLDAIASMGPRLFSRGNRRKLCICKTNEQASMGPRLFSRGNFVGTNGVPQLKKYASMGPRLFSRGNAWS